MGLLWWFSGKESSCQCRRCRFDPWSGKMPHTTEQLSPSATSTEAHARQPEKPPVRSLLTATREKPTQQGRPSTAKRNTYVKKKFFLKQTLLLLRSSLKKIYIKTCKYIGQGSKSFRIRKSAKRLGK